jgi:Cu/Ag efflux protein CusF
MIRRTGILMLLALALAGCGAKEQAKTYQLRGEVKTLDASTRSATIQHEKIGDWMEAMTMDFKVKPDSEFQKLHAGDRIEAKVVVNDLTYYVTDIKVTPKP